MHELGLGWVSDPDNMTEPQAAGGREMGKNCMLVKYGTGIDIQITEENKGSIKNVGKIDP